MTDLFDPPGGAAAEIPRDGWGRPKIVPPEGGKLVAYTRCTTFVSALEDTYSLTKWKMRQVALGLASRPDLLLSASAHRDDKHELDRIAEKALEAAGSSAAATSGTRAAYPGPSCTTKVDRLECCPTTRAPTWTPTSQRPPICGTPQSSSSGCVTPLRIGGTADRVIDLGGRYRIGDVKTGSIEHAIGKISMQLAVYAHSVAYTSDGMRHPDDKPMDSTQG
uniref:PD-(D/E)XK nuclease superfamily n=1 Tax=Nocardia farcinica TaxID=37329 RepID=A0A449GQ69_NOCFR